MIKIDGVEYDADVYIDEIEETFEKLSGEDSGRTQDGKMWIDMVGTCYNYTLHVVRKPGTSLAAYDALFKALSAPKDFNTVEFPHDQGTMIFEGYITSGSRKLLRQIDGKNYWSDISIQFIAREPQRRA